MAHKNMVCIVCPLGCRLDVELDKGEVYSVKGNNCKRGADYAVKECTNPTRILTTTVAVENGDMCVLPVKSAGEVPKELIGECVSAVGKAVIAAPVKIGQVVLKNILDTGIDIVATRNISRFTDQSAN